jgi:hypothetical protein
LDPRTLDRPEQGSTFKTLRLTSPERQETYRVTHLGDNLSQRCCYFYTRRFAYELPERLPDGEYHVRVSARDPFGVNADVSCPEITEVRCPLFTDVRVH